MLAHQAQMFPTPTVQDAENDAGPSQFTRNTPPLNTAVHGPMKQPGSLNPAWVGWLMGFPDGWLSSVPWEMRSSRKSSKNLAG